MHGSEESAPARPAIAVLGVLVFVLPLTIVASYMLPSPMALIAPAAIEPVEDLIQVDGATAHPQGHFCLATLHLTGEPRLGQYLLARLQSDVQMVPKGQVLPPTLEPAEFQELSQRLLAESQRIAEIVALRQAGAKVEVDDGEVQVMATVAGTPASTELQPGDVIEEADGEIIRSVAELVSIVREHITGEPVDLRVRRRGETVFVTLPALHGPLDTEGPVLGALLLTNGFDYRAPVEVTIADGASPAGPSAGLIYALGVYNAVVTEDITRGRRIAGTGTLRLSGAVGPVDGIALKVRAAEQAGVGFFLVPAGDAREARAAARAMEIIPVRTFAEAITALRQIGSGADRGFRVVPPPRDNTLACLPRRGGTP